VIFSDDHGRTWRRGEPVGTHVTECQVAARLSHDEGRSWTESKMLRAGDSQYSCLAQLPDGAIGCLHESDAFAALGKWDNNNFVAPSLDLIVIRQSDLAPAKGHQIAEFYQLVCDAVLTGIVIKITHKDGTTTEIKVPGDAKIEITSSNAPGEPEAVRPRTAPKTTDVRGLTPPGSPSSKSEISNLKSQIPADPDRVAAEWVLSRKAEHVAIQIEDPSRKNSSGSMSPTPKSRLKRSTPSCAHIRDSA
jgi:hypothetical protein